MVTKIATMRTLQGHPNMLELHGVFEDEEGFHVVVEYCKGAALLDQIHDRVRETGRAGRAGTDGDRARPMGRFIWQDGKPYVAKHMWNCCAHQVP